MIIQNANLPNCHDRTNSTYRKFLTNYKHERDVNHIYNYQTIVIKEFIYPFLFLYSLRLYFLCSILYLYSLQENTKNYLLYISENKKANSNFLLFAQFQRQNALNRNALVSLNFLCPFLIFSSFPASCLYWFSDIRICARFKREKESIE